MSAQIVYNYSREPMAISLESHQWLMDGDYASVRLKLPGDLWQRVAEGKKREN